MERIKMVRLSTDRIVRPVTTSDGTRIGIRRSTPTLLEARSAAVRRIQTSPIKIGRTA
jgi:hypothetical protein